MTTTNEDAGLLACPFCGGKPEMYYPFHLMGNPGQAAKYHGGVRCTKCRCESRATTPTDDSIFFWNRRAPSKVQAEAVRATESSLPVEIIKSRKAMLARLSDVQAYDRQSGGLTFYDHEIKSFHTRIFMAIDAEIERIDAAAASGGEKGEQS